MQWEGMDDEEAPYLMKEFHEHLGKLKLEPEKEERGRGVLCVSVGCVHVPSFSRPLYE